MFTKEQARFISARIRKMVSEEFPDIKIGKLSTRYGTDLRISVTLLGGDSRKEEWDAYCRFFNMKPEDLGKKTMMQGKVFTIVGVKPRGRKNTILLEDENGGMYHASHETVIPGMARFQTLQVGG